MNHTIEEISFGSANLRGLFHPPNEGGKYRVTQRSTNGSGGWKLYAAYETQEEGEREWARIKALASRPARTAEVPEVLPPESSSSVPAVADGVTPEQRVDNIVALHERITGALREFAVSVVLCGLELHALKASVGHGQWQAFCEQHIWSRGLGERHTRRYMELAEAFRRKSAKMADLPASAITAGSSGFSDEQISTVRTVLADMTDATTWHQLWMDFGLMRKAKRAGGHHPSTKAALSPEEEAAMEIEGAKAAWRIICRDLETWAIKRRSHALLSKGEMKNIHGLLIDVARAVKECMP